MGLQFNAWPTDATLQLIQVARGLATGAGIGEDARLHLIGMVTVLGIDLPANEHQAFIDHVLEAAGISVVQAQASPPPARADASPSHSQRTAAAHNSHDFPAQSRAQTEAPPGDDDGFRSNVTFGDVAPIPDIPGGFVSWVEFDR